MSALRANAATTELADAISLKSTVTVLLSDLVIVKILLAKVASFNPIPNTSYPVAVFTLIDWVVVSNQMLPVSIVAGAVAFLKNLICAIIY